MVTGDIHTVAILRFILETVGSKSQESVLDTQNYDTYIVTDPDCTSDEADIELDVFLYYDDTENKKLYLVGSKGRTIVEYEKAKWRTNLQDEVMTDSEKNVFANKSLFKSP